MKANEKKKSRRGLTKEELLLVQVRLQLQQKGQLVYKNSFDCMRKIWQNEGMAGLQKGLTPAIMREGSKNLFRIGMFDPLIQFLHDKDRDGPHIPLWKRVIAGGTSGAMGAMACNPFELVKTRMQSNAKDTIAVGHQFKYSNTFQGLWSIVSREGILALYKGSAMSVLRSTLGSGCNMAFYTGLRDYLLDNSLMPNNAFTDAFSGLVSSFFCALLMNPVDVARTRLYNQPKDSQQYKSGIDVMVQLLRNEGASAFMKGFLPSFARLGPHFTYEQHYSIPDTFHCDLPQTNVFLMFSYQYLHWRSLLPLQTGSPQFWPLASHLCSMRR